MSFDGYYRFPCIYKDKIVFVCEGDLFMVIVSEGGGQSVSQRLTTGSSSSSPIFSPSGTLLAYAGGATGSNEVYIIDADGRRPRRVTYCGGSSRPVSFSLDEQHIIFSSDYRWNGCIDRELYIVSVHGGEVTQYLGGLGPAQSISFSPGEEGCFCIGRHSYDPHVEEWKGYRGGRVGHVWISRDGGVTFERLIKDPRHRKLLNMGSPVWRNGRIYFAADPDLCGNIYSVDLHGVDLRKHTDHREFYVRNLSVDANPTGTSIVYHCGGDIYVYDVVSEVSRKIDIAFLSSRPHHATRFASASEFLEEYDLHPHGASLALISRGRPFVMNLWEGPAIHVPYDTISDVSAIGSKRYTSTAFLHDGRLIAASHDGLLHVYDTSAALDMTSSSWIKPEDKISKVSQTSPDIGEIIEIRASPKGDSCAISNHRLELLLCTLTTEGTWVTKVLDKANHGMGMEDLAWSPNGNWIAYTFPTSEVTSIIKMVNINTCKNVEVTVPRFKHSFPSFDPEGRFLYFISSRDFVPVEDEQQFAFGFPEAQRPYLISLYKDTLNPFMQMPRAPGSVGDEDEEDSDDLSGSDSDSEESEVEESEHDKELFDLEGIVNRCSAFPLPVGRYGQVEGIDEDTVIFIRLPLNKEASEEGEESESGSSAGTLLRFSFSKQKETVLIDNVLSFVLCMKLHTMAVMIEAARGYEIRVIEAGAKLPEMDSDDESIEKDTPGRESGLIDIDRRIGIEVSPLTEWKQMFEEAWSGMKEYFYDSHMGGCDWERVKQKYLPILERVGIREEFGDLIGEMVAELGVSHAYETGGDYYFDANLFMSQGFLGADVNYDDVTKAYRIVGIVRGDSWDLKRGGPLSKLGMNVEVGDYIFAINKRRLSQTFTVQQALTNMEGKELFLDIAKKEVVEEALRAFHAGEEMKMLPSAASGESDAYKVGSKIFSRYSTSTKVMRKWRDGKITRINSDGTFNVYFVDGREERNVKKKWLKLQEEKNTSKSAKGGHQKEGGSNKLFHAAGGDSNSSFSKKKKKKPNLQKPKFGPKGGKETSTVETVNITKKEEERTLSSYFDDMPYHTLRTCAISLEQEGHARYRDYVERNADFVHQLTDGKIGYVHIPDMETMGFAEFHRYYLIECSRSGLIVDVRGNLGGNVSELILEKLTKQHLGFGISRWANPSSYPQNAIRGPIVMVSDENTSSDGDIISNSFQQLKLGLLIGHRTWGGVVGIINSTPLVDSTFVTVPSEGYYANNVGWKLENHGADPDIEVDFCPHDFKNGRDPQLEKAVEVITPLAAHAEEQAKALSLTPSNKEKCTPFLVGKVEL